MTSSADPILQREQAEPPRDGEGVALVVPERPAFRSKGSSAAAKRAARRPRVSVVIPGLNEADSYPELVSRVKATLDGTPFEIVLVDDGSTDTSWSVIQSLAAADTRVHGVRLRKNFGKAMALRSGFSRAKGQIVVTMDADLQDDPADLPKFLEKIEEGFDVVVGWKQKRKDPINRLILTRIFNGVVRFSTGVRLRDMNCGFKAYRRGVVKTVPVYGDMFRFFPALAAWEGFRVTEVPITHHARKFGSSRYGLERLLRGFFDLLSVFFLTRYRRKPMHFFGLLGLLSTTFGVVFGGMLTVQWLRGIKIGDRPLLLLSVLLVLMGIQLFCTGLIGEQLTYERQKQKRNEPLPLRETT